MVLETTATRAPRPGVIALGNAGSDIPSLVGNKAAALAVARREHLPVLDGFVLSTAATEVWRSTRPEITPPGLADDLRRAREELSDGGSVIVRSSSPNEDGAASSLAGHFKSVLDVSTWAGLLEAIDEVVASAGSAPMAVLVQPFVRPIWGGVLFGADPITGRHDRRVVSAVPGGPHNLVSGTESGTQLLLSPRGRILENSGDLQDGPSARSLRRRLVSLIDHAGVVFGQPQDIEWAVVEDGTLVLLQSRPITTIGDEAAPTRNGPVLGPGPVAETFPAPLSALEADLWIPPLREGLRQALEIMGTASARSLRASPIVATVAGRPAVDLDLLGGSPLRKSWLARLDPRPPARKVLAAWRVGRLRAALPALAGDLIREIDADLRSVPELDNLSAADLLRLLDQARGVLRSLHGYEILAGQLLHSGLDDPESDAPATAVARALSVLSTERTAHPGVSDDELISVHPLLLSLSAPTIGAPPKLPPPPAMKATDAGQNGDGDVSSLSPTAETPWRESLRLRLRWVHELTARAAIALGHELVRRGMLDRAEEVRDLSLDQLHAVLAGRQVVPEGSPPTEAPLPSAFRLLANGVVIPLARSGRGSNGRGAGGGRGMGQAYNGEGPTPQDAVLVVRTLDPALAPLLPGLSGLVSETGSVLSHLAIVAREHGVPTVVDLPDAQERYPAGTWILVDGTSGEVCAVDSKEWGAA